MTAAGASGVCDGVVWHAREEAPRHAFSLRAWMLLLDLDEAPALGRRLALLGVDRARPLSFRARDHFDGRRREGARARLDRVLSRAGLPPARGAVRVLANPLVLGQGFNPVSFWWCHDEHGGLVAAVAEVNNTFGDRHPYVLPAAEAERTADGWRWRTPKRMHVSPFFDMRGEYRFELGVPGDRVVVRADLVRDGAPAMRAGFEARRLPLTDESLLRVLWRRPLMPWMVWTVIHWQALGALRRGARFHARPRRAPPPPRSPLP